jgi:SAM-dependent methyltransferase
MRLTRLGKLGLNSPTRAFAQRRVVAPLLERLGGRVDGGRALELGCGRGVGGELILERFGAAQLELVDIDPDMVGRARRRLAGRAGMCVSVGDATRIEASDGSFDAVFDFGAIHQVPEWPAAVAEVRRVLKPGARFFFEEVASPLLRWTLRFTVDGWPPSQGRPFSREAFLSELEAQGLSVGPRLANQRLLYVATAFSSGLVGDLVGVAERPQYEGRHTGEVGYASHSGRRSLPRARVSTRLRAGSERVSEFQPSPTSGASITLGRSPGPGRPTL